MLQGRLVVTGHTYPLIHIHKTPHVLRICSHLWIEPPPSYFVATPMDRRILPAAPGAMQGNVGGPPSHPGQAFIGGHPSNDDDGTKNSGRSGTGTKRRTKKDGEVEGGEDDDGVKKKKSKRRKVDHACVYCRSVMSSFSPA